MFCILNPSKNSTTLHKPNVTNPVYETSPFSVTVRNFGQREVACVGASYGGGGPCLRMTADSVMMLDSVDFDFRRSSSMRSR